MSVVNLNWDTPHNVEAEQQVLGCLLVGNGHIGSVVGRGGTALFADPVHAEIFRIMADRHKQGLASSLVAIGDILRAHEGLAQLGGPGYLARLAGVGASYAFKDAVDLVAEAKAKRELLEAVRTAGGAIARGEEQAADIASKLEASIIGAVASRDSARPVSMLSAVTLALEAADAAFRGEGAAIVPTGIDALDRLVAGFGPGELILLGGRPSMGKTGVALSVALNAARAGYGVVIVSLEMTPEAMALRAISEQTARQRNAVAYSSLKRGEMTPDHYRSAIEAGRAVATLPIQFLPRDFADLGTLAVGIEQARKLLPNDKPMLVIVDYAQLLKSNAKSRYEQITEISIALKALAMRLEVPVLALSQLSRAVEQRDEKRPMLSDLRESGQLEQDADTIMFCYRDEYYLEREKPEQEATQEEWNAYTAAMERARNRLEIIVSKQRQGAIGTAHVRFNPALNLIWEDGR